MIDTEEKYSQTGKEALAIRLAKNRFKMYLLGAQRFKIITAHKPVLPMFNKNHSQVATTYRNMGDGYARCRL